MRKYRTELSQGNQENGELQEEKAQIKEEEEE